MGRRSQGFAIRWHRATSTWLVWWWDRGKRYERSTRVRERSNRAAALREAGRVYTEWITGAERQRSQPRRTGDLKEWVKAWVAELPLRTPTRKHYANLSVLWLRRWPRIEHWTDANMAAWVRERLRTVRAKSVRTESSALRNLIRYLTECGAFTTPPTVPPVPRGATGKPSKKRTRTRAPDLTPAEIRKLIAALPERSDRAKFPVRARFVVGYETTLRPETLSKLRVPENYSRGGKLLRVRDEDDKEGMAREIPLSKAARRALDSVCPDVGLIFGRRRYERYLAAAAAKALPPDKARIFCGQHMRSAALTHFLEETGNLPGAQHYAGHVNASTTALYVRPSLRAARDLLRKRRR